MDISFIIPAYNAVNTIEKTIDSIINQADSLLKYEIIVIDDGSTDDLKHTLKKYGREVKYYRKENGGVSSARNYGVARANGKYTIFVDSDDFVSTTLLQDIQNYIVANYDLIKWSPLILNENEELEEEPHTNEYVKTSGENGFNRLYGTDPLLDCLWNYAIRTSLIPQFPEGKYHEDFAIMPLIILKAEKMVITNKVEYCYVQTDSSIMRGDTIEKERKKLEDILTHFDNLIKVTSKMKIKDVTKENVGIFATNSLIVIRDLYRENKKFFKIELKKRKIWRYIKIRNIKQLAKKVLIFIYCTL